MEEGILYAKNQLAELRYEEAFIILSDAMEGIITIKDAIEPMKNKLPNNKIDILLIDVKESIDKSLNFYKKEQKVKLEAQIIKETLPVFLRWKEEVRKTLKPYIVS